MTLWHLLTLHAILVLFLTQLSLILNIFHPCLNPALSLGYSWLSSDPEHFWPFYCSNHYHISHPFQSWLLQLSFLNLPRSQMNRLKLILNSAARAVSIEPLAWRFSRISPIIRSLHWWLKLINASNKKLYLLPTKHSNLKTILAVQPSQPPSQHFLSLIYYYYSTTPTTLVSK